MEDAFFWLQIRLLFANIDGLILSRTAFGRLNHADCDY